MRTQSTPEMRGKERPKGSVHAGVKVEVDRDRQARSLNNERNRSNILFKGQQKADQATGEKLGLQESTDMTKS